MSISATPPQSSARAADAIVLEGLRKVYGRGENAVVALDGIDMRVPAGAIHGIVGQSGAGKSTLVRCLTALEHPTEGSVWVDGRDVAQLRGAELREARRNIGMVFQHAELLDSLTTACNIAYPLALAGVPHGVRRQRVAELLELVGLADRGHHYPSELSGGQRQRVGIARALADNPPVLLCDEPTSALDADTTRQVLELIRDVRDRYGVTVLIITHEMSVVRSVCDSVTLLEDGRIVEHGTLSEVVADPNSRLARDLVPIPAVNVADHPAENVIDVAFTSHPGEPTGSHVMGLAASLGADVAGGVFETLGTTQIGRLVLTVPPGKARATARALRQDGLHAEVRA
ncbi:methionine ABC transporter ATP-binding protein [Buchananella hordeovulneris]|uniref:methionine ABC transporter ATP-binding protein n=1 Tax=Buchananella hordeovulneris TaxID=52770 RepID=UPI0026C426B3